MNTYILLRKNKESGPFSLDELKNQGLKNDDLVWVEGQSACWLNPGDIRQLKDLVGAKQEVKTETLSRYQPPEPELQEVETSISTNSDTATTSPTPAVKNNEKKTVFVAMPVTPVKPEEPEFKTELPKKEIRKQVQVVVDEEVPVETQTKYTRSLDDIKEMYVKTLQQRKKRGVFKLVIPPQVKRIGFYAGLIVIGVVAGLLLRKSGGKKQDLVSRELHAPAQTQLPVNEETTDLDQSVQKRKDTDPELLSDSRLETGEKRRIPKEQVSSAPVTINDGDDEQTGLTPPSRNTERVVQSRDEIKQPKTNTGEDLASLVSVKSNNYIVASFGGIKNLQLTVKNDSKFTLDKVIVELQYLKPRDELLRTENVYFTVIPPNTTQTVAIKKTTRGVKVNYRIIRIESKENGGTTAGL
jgi:hypothetical protein